MFGCKGCEAHRLCINSLNAQLDHVTGILGRLVAPPTSAPQPYIVEQANVALEGAGNAVEPPGTEDKQKHELAVEEQAIKMLTGRY